MWDKLLKKSLVISFLISFATFDLIAWALFTLSIIMFKLILKTKKFYRFCFSVYKWNWKTESKIWMWISTFISIGYSYHTYIFLITFIFLLFFLIGIYLMQGWTTTTRHEVTRKRNTKRLKHTGNLFRKNLLLIGVC